MFATIHGCACSLDFAESEDLQEEGPLHKQDIEYLLCRNMRKAGFLSPAFCTPKVRLNPDLA
jgi:hypothetical protein